MVKSMDGQAKGECADVEGKDNFPEGEDDVDEDDSDNDEVLEDDISMSEGGAYDGPFDITLSAA